MQKFMKAIAALMLTITVVCAAGCTKPDDPDNGGDNNGGGGSEAGLYLGVIGFNDQLKTKPIGLLNTSTEHGFIDFIDALTTRDGTALYHAEYTALDWLQNATIPNDLTNVSIVTFTDGLDNASMMLNNHYSSQMEFLNAINDRIKTDKVGGLNINAYAVGMRGNDVQDVAGFRRNLQQLSSSPLNVFEVENMDSVAVMFSEIATQLYNETTIFLGTGVKIPGGYDNNTVIRITFDYVDNVNTSNKYIEGIYTRENGRGKLSNVNYCGLQSTSGTEVISDRQDGAYYWFTFADLKTLAGVPVTNTSDIKLWRYVTSTAEWQPESEFTPSNYSEIQAVRKSAVIVLVLDCTTSLGTADFYKMKSAAEGFVELINHYGNGSGEDGSVPSVITLDATNVTSNLACCGGAVLGNGGSVITRRGVCWSLQQNPTLEDNYVFDDNPYEDQFSFVLSGLESGKTYFYRAFAINGIGVGYGAQKSFTTGANGGNTTQSLPYIQNFVSDFGTYTTFDVSGPQSWKIDYNTASMTGFANSTNYVNEDWLISSPVAITGVSDAKMTMVYIGRYFSNINEEVTIWASTNYTWGSDPTTAAWTQIPASLTEGNNWNDFLTAEISLTQFIGQTITMAVKYTSTDSKAGTMEIQSITIEEGSGPTPPPGPGTGGEVQNMPYTQSFTSDFGTYMAYDIMGDQSWEIDFSTAKMTGYVYPNYFANEDWLISSPVAITGVTDAKMTMVYIGRYFSSINDEVTIWVSTNYTWGSSPMTASWTQVPASLREASNWNDFLTAEISLTQYVGQTVTIAVKYTSTDSKAGTMEIQSICIEEGSGVTPPPGPGQGEGSGTADDPYNVAAGIGLQGQNQTAWVHGYIVGSVKSGTSTVTSNADVNWSGPFDSSTNVVIADDASCNEITQCIIVSLPAGKPLRTQVNLLDNPDNLGKQLAVLGTLRVYFGQAGLRDSNGTENDFVLEGAEPPTPGTNIFSETFASGQGSFTIQDVMLPEELTFVWAHAPSYSCMKASAYVGQAYTTESWLVSPAIDLTGVSAATLKFDQAVNYASPQGALSVMISTNYDGDVTTATWTELNLSQWPSGSDWTFINSTADLTGYVGQTVTIAFKYTSTANASATWEVKNFVVE